MGIVPGGYRFFQKAKDVNNCLKLQCNNHNEKFLRRKDKKATSHRNQNNLPPNRKSQYIIGNILSTFFYESYFFNNS